MLSRGSIISEDSHPADEEDYYEEDNKHLMSVSRKMSLE